MIHSTGPTPAAMEIVQIVDRQNRIAGEAPRAEMRARGLIHRACYILVFDDRERLFIQQRTTTKDIYPGYWDVAAGGVVLAGETYEESAARELEEELGVTVSPLVHLFDNFYERDDNKVWGRIFRCRHDGPFTLQAEEVADGRFASLEEVFLLSRKQPFTPDGLQILQRITSTP